MIASGSLWPTRPLGEIVEVLDGRRVPVSAAERAARPGSVPYFGATGRVGSIDAALFDEPLLLLGEDGVQFFDRHRPKAYLVDGPAWVNNHAHVLRARKELVERRFLLHYLNVFDFAGYANGTTRLKLTQAAMRRIPVPVPPLDEQRRIVGILEDHLSRLDAAVQGLRVAERKVRAWSMSAIDAEVWASESQVTREIRSLLGERPRNGHSARASRTGHGIRALTLTAVTRRSFSDEFTKIVTADERRVRDLWLEPGDIFVQRSNTAELVGSVAMYSGRTGWAIFPDLLIRLRVDGSKAIPAYVEAAMRSERAHRALRAQAKGLAGSMPKIDQAAIASLSIPVPPIGRQAEIAQRVAEIDDARTRLIEGTDRAAQRAAGLRRSLLDAAFSGRLTGASSDVDRVEELAGV